MLELEPDYDFIPVFAEQALITSQMRNLIMTTKEKDRQAEREGERERERERAREREKEEKLIALTLHREHACMNAPERRESGARRGNRDRTMEGAMSFPLMGCQRSDINSRPHATVEFIGSRFNFIPPANRSSTLRIDLRSTVALVDRGICNGKENDDAFQ